MNSRIYIIFLLLFCSTYSFAQYTLRIEITATPPAHKEDGVFVAGNFNNWNPGNGQYRFSNENDKLVMEIKDLPSKKYEFKFTRGEWQKVESSAKGIDVNNKQVQLSSDTILRYTIDGWMDDLAVAKQH